MRSRPGFIQIPLLIGIIVSIITISVGIGGAALYKKNIASSAKKTPITQLDYSKAVVPVNVDIPDKTEKDNKSNAENAQLEQERARLSAKIQRAKLEAENIAKTAREKAEKDLQKQLDNQRLADELKKQQELEKLYQQEKAKERLEQEEQNRVNQIYTQTDALFSEYYQKINDIDGQILAINQKYYEDADTSKLRQEGISAFGIQARISELTREANREIELLQFEKESLRIEYLNKISILERSL
ncbi:MAG TPA: hypothetical protein ENH85_03330 [Candidatus Scalindua sp.]|nr:hypothetical protein [Candidatus Scalindua sp.]